MKLGFVSAILDTYTFEEVIDFASSHGFECVEMACWPGGKAERRYAGVSHINVDDMSEENIAYIKDYCAKKNVEMCIRDSCSMEEVPPTSKPVYFPAFIASMAIPTCSFQEVAMMTASMSGFARISW